MKWLVKFSVKLGSNIIDYIRVLYFALFGSAALNFAIKWKSFDLETRIYFVFGISLFMIGLITSTRISNSFKEYAKDFPGFDDLTRKKYNNSLLTFIIEKKEKGVCKIIQHIILYSFIIFGCVSIGYSGYLSEKTSSLNNKNQKDTIEQIAKEVRSFKTNLDSIEISVLKLYDLELKNYRILDSLKRVKSRQGKSIVKSQ